MEFFCFVTLPWRECEMCYIGPYWLNEGTHYSIGFALFFIEFHVTFRRKPQEIRR
jgi:hypothetical protein